MRIFDRVFVHAVALALAGCAAQRPLLGSARELAGNAVPELPNTTLNARGQRVWAEHLATSTDARHQPQCAPRRWAPATEPKGLVVIFHGFSACPDQFDELGPKFADAGYEVLVPLLPGHGLARPAAAPSKTIVDDLSTLPTRRDWERYRDFGESWAEVLANAKGEHVVLGYSVGGAVAAMAIASHPSDVNRAVLIAPFFSISSTFARVLLGVAQGVDALLTTNPIDPLEFHWGPKCEVEHQGGRGGYCSFQVNHVAATQLSGADARKMLERASRLPPIQLLVIDDDDAVDTSVALDALNGVAPKSPQVRVCEFPPGFPHSFFSPHDNPGMPRPWLPDFTKAAVELVTGGTFFAPGACPGSPNH